MLELQGSCRAGMKEKCEMYREKPGQSAQRIYNSIFSVEKLRLHPVSPSANHHRSTAHTRILCGFQVN